MGRICRYDCRKKGKGAPCEAGNLPGNEADRKCMPGMQTENGAEIRGSRRPDEGSKVFDFKKKAASREAAGKKRRSETPEADLKHLDRIRLMELIVEQRKRIEELENRLEKTERRLEERTIRFDVENVSGKEDLVRAIRSVLGELEGSLGE